MRKTTNPRWMHYFLAWHGKCFGRLAVRVDVPKSPRQAPDLKRGFGSLLDPCHMRPLDIFGGLKLMRSWAVRLRSMRGICFVPCVLCHRRVGTAFQCGMCQTRSHTQISGAPTLIDFFGFIHMVQVFFLPSNDLPGTRGVGWTKYEGHEPPKASNNGLDLGAGSRTAEPLPTKALFRGLGRAAQMKIS